MQAQGVVYMDISANGFIPYEMKTSLVKITSYDDGALEGTLSNPYFPAEMRFSNVVQFLRLVEEMLDALRCPQKAMESRSFKPAAAKKDAAPRQDGPDEKVLATFKLNVLFRQNASWQGRLVWVEQKSEAQFRSVLELVMLMDSVLQ